MSEATEKRTKSGHRNAVTAAHGWGEHLFRLIHLGGKWNHKFKVLKRYSKVERAGNRKKI